MVVHKTLWLSGLMQTEVTGASCSGERHSSQHTAPGREQQHLEHSHRARFMDGKDVHTGVNILHDLKIECLQV